ncbi:MAG: sigma-54-dependent Fis family transcriptional regulator, partial [Acidobacteria bacterium]|nr:sigma-54-dependent Fis family transcriptional regulator [Acidobacteriota bacterium]MDW7985357.1 helix-turn-helix domain-containing protein [Acidobacteriota bacterium]
LAALVEYSWPGNVRELEHTIERAVVLAQGPVIDIDLLPEPIVQAARGVRAAPIERVDRRLSFRERVDNYKRALILQALREAGGIQRKAAALLRIKPTTLHEMMKRYKIRPPESDQDKPL